MQSKGRFAYVESYCTGNSKALEKGERKLTHTKRERDAILRNGRPTTQTSLKVPQEMKGSGGTNDPLENITKAMDYSVPRVGDNVFKIGKLVRVCSTKGCYEPVFVSKVCDNGSVEYHCVKHGKRNRQQMLFMDITGSTMIQFRKIGG